LLALRALRLDDNRNHPKQNIKIAAWKTEYNEARPHSSLGYLTPNEFAERERMSSGKDACQKTASLENAEERVSHFPTAPFIMESNRKATANPTSGESNNDLPTFRA